MGHTAPAMSERPPDTQSSLPPARRRGPGPGFFSGLIAIMRLGLLAITFVGTLNALTNVFHSGAVSRTTGAPPGLTSLALAMAAAAAVLMVALTLNVAFLVDRLFSRRVAAYLTATVFVLAVGSVAVGHLGSAKLGAVVIAIVVIPAAAFVLSVLLVRYAGPALSAPSSRRPAAPAAPRPPAPLASQRRRRGRRKR